MTGTITLWVFGLLCFVVAFVKDAASAAGINLPGPKTLGARAGVIMVGVLALILGTVARPKDGGSGDTATTPPSATTPAVTGTGTAPNVTTSALTSQDPVTASSSSATGLKQIWTGPVSIPMDGSLDFDQTPPGPGDGTKGISAVASSTTTAKLNDTLVTPHNTFGVWPADKPAPSPKECADFGITHPAPSGVHVGVGSLVCLSTPNGRTVLLKIDQIRPADYALDATATMWDSTS